MTTAAPIRTPTETRRAVMLTAWRIYRRIYGQSGFFTRARFGACLRMAWQEAKAAAPLPPVEAIERELALLPYRANHRETQSVRAHLEAQRAALPAS